MDKAGCSEVDVDSLGGRLEGRWTHCQGAGRAGCSWAGGNSWCRRGRWNPGLEVGKADCSNRVGGVGKGCKGLVGEKDSSPRVVGPALVLA